MTNTDIRASYNGDACKGGVNGASDYCRDGYEGPCEHRSKFAKVVGRLTHVHGCDKHFVDYIVNSIRCWRVFG